MSEAGVPLIDRAYARRQAYRQLLVAALALALFGVSGYGSEASVDKLLDAEALKQALALFGGLLTPDFSAAFVVRVGTLTLESMAIATVGMALALVIGIPLALLAARVPRLENAPQDAHWRRLLRGAVRWWARTGLSILRAIPEIVWAFLFVRVLGLGPGPAVLAIGLTFGGIVGKLFAELIDASDAQPARALEAAGGSRWAIVLHAVLPQVRTQWLGYGLFRFECAIRSAAILGVVGAGGLGAEIELSIRYFQWHRLATTLLALLGCVAVVEMVSAYARQRKQGTRLALGVAGAALALSLWQLDVDWPSLWSSQALVQTKLFLSGVTAPTTATAELAHALWLMLQTIAMAAFATLLAALAALLVAPFASRVLTVGGFLLAPPVARSKWHVLLHRSVLLSARGILQLTRAMPELVWALLLVVWVGPGPFAGALAIAAHTFGVLGRLFGEVYEDVEARRAKPPQLIEATGGSRFATWCHGVLPQCAAQLSSYTLFRFEVNVRATAMVGFVGAGGIGDAIHTSISLFHMSDLAMQLQVLLLAVVVVDIVGETIRRRLLAT